MAKKIYLGKNPWKKKKEKQNHRCPYCGRPLQMVPVSEMNFRFHLENEPEFYWRCSNYPTCDAYVAADRKTKEPYGTLANQALRYKRRSLHQWKDILEEAHIMTPGCFMELCGRYMGLWNPNCVHIRNMSEYTCDQILAELQNLYDKDPNIKKTVDSKKFSAPWRQVRGINTIGKPGIFFNEDGEPIERPAGMPGYKPVVTAGAENGKRLARERIPLSDVELRELQEVAHKYVLEAAAEKAKKAS